MDRRRVRGPDAVRLARAPRRAGPDSTPTTSAAGRSAHTDPATPRPSGAAAASPRTRSTAEPSGPYIVHLVHAPGGPAGCRIPRLPSAGRFSEVAAQERPTVTPRHVELTRLMGAAPCHARRCRVPAVERRCPRVSLAGPVCRARRAAPRRPSGDQPRLPGTPPPVPPGHAATRRRRVTSRRSGIRRPAAGHTHGLRRTPEDSRQSRGRCRDVRAARDAHPGDHPPGSRSTRETGSNDRGRPREVGPVRGQRAVVDGPGSQSYSSHSVTNSGFAWMCTASYPCGPVENRCGVSAGTTST